MDRARQPGPARSGRAATGRRAGPGGALRRGAAAAALCAALACSGLSPDLDSVIAIEVVISDSVLAAGDTLYPRARALNGRGDSVDTPVFWAAIDTGVFTIDETTGVTFAAEPGAGRIQARVTNLRSAPVMLVFQGPLDSMRAVGDTADTVQVSSTPRDTLSDFLRVRVFADALRMTPQQAVLRRPITYVMDILSGAGAAVTLVPNDTGFTNAQGTFAVQVRLDSGPPPVSVRVKAVAVHPDGTVLPDSITFVVEFRP